MTQIDPNLLLPTAQQQSMQPQNVLGQDAFMKLLITQLRNQDPTNPMEDREYIAQLATFSQLEQLTQLNQTMMQMYVEQKSQQLIQLSEIIGKDVTWKNEEGEGTGEVTGVKYAESGKMVVEINNEKWIEANTLIQVR